MKELFSYTKLFTLLITIFYIAGLLATFYNSEILFSLVVFISLAILIIFLNLDYKKALALCLLFFLGITRAVMSLDLENIIDNISSNEAKLSGLIVSNQDFSTKNNKIKFYLKVNKANIDDKKYENLNTKVLVSIDNNNNLHKRILIGDYVTLEGKLRYPLPSTNPYQFDYQKYLLNNDVKNILYAQKYKKTGEVDFNKDFEQKWYFILRELELTRNKIIEKHSKYIKSPRLEVLGGIVFGNETINVDEITKEHFKNSGLLHLLAASGLNVALIYGIWWWIASLVRFPYNLSILIGAIFVIAYTFMTGFPPSILRASIMLLFVLFGKIIDRNVNSLALIFFVGFLILLVSPKMLFDIGFQLSFIVTIGLVTCCPILVSKFDKMDKEYKEKYKDIPRYKKYLLFLFSPRNIVAILSTSFIAQLFVVPLQMHYFNTFTPFSILANIVVVPFVGILSFIGFVSSIISIIPVLNNPMTFIFDLVANPLLIILMKISEIFSSFKYSIISTTGLNIFQIFLSWTIIFLFILGIKHNFKNVKIRYSIAICILVLSITFIKFDNHTHNLEVNMFDVENADSFLIRTPENKYIIIDTGKKSFKGVSCATMIINKFLNNERIKNLKLMIVTHYDSDHCSGVIEILKNTKTDEILVQSETPKSQMSKEIIDYLKNNKLNYRIAKNNEEVYFEKDLTVRTFKIDSNDENDASIITLIKYKDKNLLFMGDASTSTYNKIKKYLPENIEILKVGHHGAKGSVNDKMIKEIKPKYALISAGYTKFNHPHFTTIDVLTNNNVEIISTKNYGYSKIVLNDNIEKFYYFDSNLKKIKKIKFYQNVSCDFTESEFFKNLIYLYQN